MTEQDLSPRQFDTRKEPPPTKMLTLKDYAKVEHGGGGAQAVALVDPMKIEIEEGFNPRDVSKRAGQIDWLAQDITQQGVLNPLIVRVEDGRMILVDGHLRLAAVKLALEKYGAEIHSIPVRHEPKGTTPSQRLVRATTSYASGDPLTVLEQAHSVQRLLGMGLARETIARSFCVTTARISQLLDIESMPEEMKTEVEEGTISPALAVKIVTEQGATAAIAAVRVAKKAPGIRQKGKKGRKVKPAEVQAASRGAPVNLADIRKETMLAKKTAKAIVEMLDVMRTIWLRGNPSPMNGKKISIEFTPDDFHAFEKKLFAGAKR